jgi:hypothetical protein
LEPFKFLSHAPADGPARRWGSWYVVEKYPHILPWAPPAGSSTQFLTYGPNDGKGYALFHRGLVECDVCREHLIHTLVWPEDAWWQWSIRGNVLWAWDRKHAEQILEYVRATDRPARSTSGPIGSIPSHFLSAKVRGAVVKAIERKLAAT